jgi:PAS domain S-box-containing protein
MFAQKLSRWHLLSSWLIIATLIILFGIQLALTQYQNLHDEIDQFKAQELLSRNALNKSAIKQTISYIDHRRNNLEENFRNLLKKQTLAFVDILQNSHENKAIDLATAQKIAQTFSKRHDIDVRFHQSEPDLDLQGYHRDNTGDRIGYVFYYEPLGRYILGYQSLQKFVEKIQLEILETLRYIRFGKENSGYIFAMEVHNLQGGKGFATEILLPIDPSKEGLKIDSDRLDELGNPYREDYLAQIRTQGYALTRYSYPSDDQNIAREKISYLEFYEPWNWIIGTGVYFDFLNEGIEAYKERSIERLRVSLYFLVLVLFLFSAISYAISRYFNRRLLNEVHNYEEQIQIHQNELSQYKHAVIMSTIYSKTDPKGIITDVNQEFCRVSGYEPDELLGKTHSLIRHPEEPDSVFKDMWETIKSKQVFKGVLKNRAKNGAPFYTSITIVPILTTQGEIKEYITLRIDITEQMEQERRIQRQITDRLTGLSNIERLREDIRTHLGDKLGLIKITGLKDISTFYGQDITESLIKICAQELQGLTQKEPATLYRFAFDTFALLGTTNSKKENFIYIMRACIDSIKTYPKSVARVEFDVGAHGGIAFGSEHLLQETGAALDQARNDHKDLIVFDKNLSILQIYETNIAWTRILKNAVENGGILAYGQAIVNTTTQEISKYEVLMRLRKENGEIISPVHFLPVAKRTSLYLELSRQVIQMAFLHFKKMQIPFSVNLSAQDIKSQEMVEFIEEQVVELAIGKLVTFEIVETESVESFSHIAQFIDRMKKLGAKIAIDDFGTGYSNFEYLLKIKADYIKIDGSLIKNIDTDENCQKVVAVVVAFANSAGMKVVAEFVHSEAIVKALDTLGVHYCQGYFFHQPESLDTLPMGKSIDLLNHKDTN